jgi:hypothetical protein
MMAILMKEIFSIGIDKDKEPKFFQMVNNFRANSKIMFKMGLESIHGIMATNTKDI